MPDHNRPTPQDYADLFEVDRRGARILDDLIQRFSQPQVSRGGIDAVLMTYERGGMRKVLDHIIRQINRANGVPTTETEE